MCTTCCYSSVWNERRSWCGINMFPTAGTAGLFYEVTAGHQAVSVNKLWSLCPSPHSQSSHLSSPPTLRHSLSPTETQRLFPWHPFTVLPSGSVCTALRLCAASLTHWDNVYLFIFTGEPSPHHRQRRLTRCRPLCKYLFSLPVQYVSLSFTRRLRVRMSTSFCARVDEKASSW